MASLTQEQADLFAEYSADPVKFIDERCYRKVPGMEPVLFNMYDWQKTLVRHLHQGFSVVVVKSRQVGCSWCVAAYALWLAIFRPGSEIIFLSIKEKDARKLLRRKFRFMAHHLPEWILGNEEIYIGYDRVKPPGMSIIHAQWDMKRQKYVPVAESTIDAYTTTGDSARGDTASFVLLDEWASLPNDVEMWSSIKPALSRGGQICGVSTPKGYGNVFAGIVSSLESGDMETFKLMRVHYTDCGFGEEWLARVSEGMTQEQIDQEFEMMFLQGGRPVFPLKHLAAVYRPLTHPQGFDALMEEYAYYLSLAELPHEREDCEAEFERVCDLIEGAPPIFYSGVDSSEGVGMDYNSITALNAAGVQVAAEHNHMSLGEWAGLIRREPDGTVTEMPGFVVNWHKQYPGLMVIEENGPGLVVKSHYALPDDDVSRVILKRAYDTMARTGMKSQMVLNGQRMIEGHRVTITDRFTFKCLCAYTRTDNGRTTAPKGMYDDPVMSFLWAAWGLARYGEQMEPSQITRSSEGMLARMLRIDSARSSWGGFTDSYAPRGPSASIDFGQFDYGIKNRYDLKRIRTLR